MAMNPPEANTENFELPQPSAGAQPEMPLPSAEHGFAPEQQSTSGASDPSGAAFVPQTAATAPVPPVAGMPVAEPTASAHTAGLTADDADLIEKTWVEKAKQIVAETRGDPYTQNKEINKVKADYIKKRYNKDIKLASE